MKIDIYIVLQNYPQINAARRRKNAAIESSG